MSLVPLTGSEVRVFRTSLGMTQQQLAEALGASKRAVEGWEAEGTTGGRSPPTYLRLAFAAINAKLEPWG